jgi:nucleotide-binding universal stress UspA family protein
MKKILIAVDYFPTSQKVAELGHAIAKAMNAETILLHVMANPGYYASSIYDPIMGYGGYMHLDFFHPDIVSLLNKESKEYLEKIKIHLGGGNISSLVEQGNIADTILETAEHNHVDMIVMGSHSKNWFENILIGSEAERVLHNSKIPLTIVPTKEKS